jgi:hypothetical protein
MRQLHLITMEAASVDDASVANTTDCDHRSCRGRQLRFVDPDAR